MPQFHTVVRSVLGILLLAAAGLKLYGLSVSAVPLVGWFAQPWVQLAAVEWELALGLWLLSGAYPVGSWLAAVGTFLAFAGVSAYLGWVGVASCGCFGTVHASPWYALAVDLFVLSLLALTRPARRAGSEPAPAPGWGAPAAAWVLCSAVTVLLVVTAAGSWLFGSPARALARLRGDVVAVEGGYVDFGVGGHGEVLAARVRVRNWSDTPVRIVGGTSDCACVTTAELPRTIEPGEACELLVHLRVPPSGAGRYERDAELWADRQGMARVRFRAACRIRPIAQH